VRVLLVVHQFFPRHQTGTESYTYGIAKELSKRHDVRLFYREHGRGVQIDRGFAEEDAIVDGLPVHRVYVGRRGIRGNPLSRFQNTYDCRLVEKSFDAFLDRVRPDVVHFQHLMFLSGDLVRIARRRHIPVLLTLHDYWLLCANSQLVRPSGQLCEGHHLCWECVSCGAAAMNAPLLRYLKPAVAPLFIYRDRFLRRRLREIEHIIAPSEFLKAKFVAAGVPSERIRVLENGIDTSGLSYPVHARRSRAPIRLGYIGSIAWQKGVHVLVEALASVTADVEVVVYGDGRLFPEYSGAVRAQAQGLNMDFRGPFHHADVWQVLSGMDALVVPSVWYENSPLVIREAYAAKVPVIASDVGALAEKVRDGVDGRLFPCGDAAALAEVIQDVAEHPEQLEAMRRNIQPVLTIEEHVRELELTYQALIAEGST
jgi:glycosyltransferase involved in cell wall biosynthesis